MTAIGKPEAVARLPLSFNQEFLCMFDAGDDSGPFGPQYHVASGWRLSGPVDPGTLREALTDVVTRHETLRTVIVREGKSGYQLVYPPNTPRLDVQRCPGVSPGQRAHQAEALLTQVEASSMSATELPHLRAVLMQFDDQDSVLVLTTHHLATDGWSMRVIARDLAICYAARRSNSALDLPPMRPYRDFVAWERQHAATGAMAPSVKYWQDTLDGARLTAFKADHPRSARLPEVTTAHRFRIGAELISDVTRLAKAARCTPFMVLLAAYYQLLHKLTGVTDLVVPTHTLGRGSGMFNATVGSFFNFLPLRINLSGRRDAADLLSRTRDTCIGAYTYDIPAIHVFASAPDLMATAMQDSMTPVTFQVHPLAFVMDGTRVGNIEYTEIRRRLDPVGVSPQLPDGALWTLSFDPAGEVLGTLRYRTDRFNEQTIIRLINEYQQSLRDLVAEYDRLRTRKD